MNQEFLKEKIDLVLKCLTSLEDQEFGADVDPWKGFARRDFGIGIWDWPQGVGLYGMDLIQSLYGDNRYDDFFENWVKQNSEEGLPSANINTTAPFLMLLGLAERTGNPLYHEMCRERARWLLEELPRTGEGGFQHVTTDLFDKNGVILNENQLWVDTLFMSVLFLSKAGILYQQQQWVDEAVYQILIHIKYLYDVHTGLLYHGFSFERIDHFGGILWSRGNSWFTYGILKLLEILGDQMTAPVKEHICNTFKAQVRALRGLQSESGLWHTILTDPDSYEEVSGTALFAAAIFKGVGMGLLAEEYLPCARKALAAVITNIDDNGSVRNVSGGTAIGLNAEHYKNIIIATMPYGQAMVVLALAEALEFCGKN